VHHPSINRVAALVTDAVARLGTPIYTESSRTRGGGLRYLQVTVAARGDGGAPHARVWEDATAPVQVVLVWGWRRDAPGAAAHAAALADALWEEGEGGIGAIHSVHHNWQPATGNRVTAASPSSWDHVHGPPFAWQAAGGACVAYAAAAFCQANPAAFGALVGDVAAAHAAAGVAPTTLVDLHAGAGAVGLALAAREGGPAAVRAVDVNPAGAAPLAASAARLAADAGAAGREPPVISFEATTAADAAGGGALTRGDGVVVDPPRKGLEPALLAALAAPPSGMRSLTYIACHFPSLARDGDALLAGGAWALVGGAARVFFPGTDAVESAAVFVRRE
jgi:tRNA/tmRNA/rRNA uracil-C5-methylase (TrmA/RlmC/RlmD family)